MLDLLDKSWNKNDKSRKGSHEIIKEYIYKNQMAVGSEGWEP